MSEKTKTPRELADQFVARRVEFSGEDESPNISSSIDKELKWAYLAGLEAGAKMGYVEAITDCLGSVVMSKDEAESRAAKWWASLEGEKSST